MLFYLIFRLTIEKRTVIIVLGSLIGVNILTLAGFLAMVVAYNRGRGGQATPTPEGDCYKK